MSPSKDNLFTIPITELSFFSPLLKDYINKSDQLNTLFQFPFNLEGLHEASTSKSVNFSHRDTLKSILAYNYPDENGCSEAQQVNLQKLKSNGLAVTTAHQPNLFLGPFYVFSKAISTIALAQQLNNSKNGCHYSPIFVIGSEDHDKEELLNVTLFDKRYEWNTPQTGAVGRMYIDDACIELLEQFLSTFGTSDNALQLAEIYRNSYTLGNTLSAATAQMLNSLFGHHGLIVLDIAIPEVKKSMQSVFQEELSASISIQNIQPAIDFLSSNYSVQASARNINLFEYKDNQRIRIENNSPEIQTKLINSPELFSPNVILRPLMQQMVLPSVCNLGGGAEVAYWLQLKANFDYFKVDFPAIGLRDIFTIIDGKSWEKWQSYDLSIQDFFVDLDSLKRMISLKDSTLDADISQVNLELNKTFETLKKSIESIDKSLVSSIEAEKIKALKSIDLIKSKAIRSEKKRHEELLLSVEKIKHRVFENNVLRERKENFASFYIKYGAPLIDNLLEHSNPLDFKFKLVVK